MEPLLMTNLEAFSNRSPWIRAQALEQIKSVDAMLSTIAARAGITDGSPSVRLIAVEILGSVGNKHLDTPRLGIALLDDSWMVRSSASIALGQLGGAKAFKLLVSRISSDSSEVVRRDIASALSGWGEKAVPVLEDAFAREKSPIAQCGLIRSIYVTTGKGLARLISMMEHKNHLVRRNAFGWIEKSELTDDDLNAYVRGIRHLIATDSNPGNVTDAVKYLTQLEA